MKRLLLLLTALCGLTVVASAQYQFRDATSLTLYGKLLPTEHPYERLDSLHRLPLTDSEAKQARCPTGVAVAFRTDSPEIGLRVTMRTSSKGINSASISTSGFDLYILHDGRWIWAGSRHRTMDTNRELTWLVQDMDGSVHDCLLYLPLQSQVASVDVAVDKGGLLEAIEPLPHKVVVFGSSFTQGSGTTRPGMAWSSQLSRRLGFQAVNMGFSGNSKLQPYFADILAEPDDVDAYILDAFSNPSPEQIEERLFPFIEKIRARRPHTPLIFLKTIYRENRTFSTSKDRKEREKMAMADSLMRIAVERYDDVYWITSTDASDPVYHETTTDGIHPDDYGYVRWTESIRKPVLQILRQYGIL